MKRICAMVTPCLVAGLTVLASCGGGGGAAPALPVATTLGSKVVSTSQETVYGSVDPNGRDTEYWFEWSTDSTLTNPSKTTPKTLAASSSVQEVNDALTGLAAGTKIHYRLRARNADGTGDGEVKACFHYANVVFVTSALGTGNLGGWANAGGKSGREAGNAICQALASGAGLQGRFEAWLSDSAGAPSDRMAHSAARYMRVDGIAIGNSWSDFTTAPYLDSPIDRDERGLDPPDKFRETVRTETRVGGNSRFTTGNACKDWTSAEVADWVGFGVMGYPDYQWTEAGYMTCAAPGRLYCFQQNLDLPQERCSTGCPGPLGWVWHVSACSKGLYQDPDCKYVCCNFFDGTRNCNTIPASFGGYTVTSCSYNTGLYSMAVSHDGQPFTVTCEVY